MDVPVTTSEQTTGLVVMYHYVRPDGHPVPAGIRPLWVSEFEKQLDWLSQRYDILGGSAFLERMGHAERDPEKQRPVCLLTFDDGTSDHATVVTPILKQRGLSGIFFVLSGPPTSGMMPLTHAVHWLLGGDDQAVWQGFERYARDSLGGLAALGDAGEARRIYHYESELRGRIKYAANMALPAEATQKIVELALKQAGMSTTDLAAEWFVSADDIAEMDAAGMTIGLHGRSHRNLQSLGASGIRDEILHCSQFVNRVTGKTAQWWACPFGGSGASAEAVAGMRAAMLEVKIRASVSTQKRLVQRGEDLLALPRFDAIDLPPRGKGPA